MEAGSWRLTQGFVWSCRRTDNGETAQAERDAFLEKERWMAANSRMGTPDDLNDDCVRPTPGGMPAELRFSPDKWATVGVASSEE